MPRRRIVAKREILPDPKYGNVTLAKFMNHVMISGKKSVAERIVYGALDIVKDKSGNDPLDAFQEALDTIAPMVEVKSRQWVVRLIRCLLKCAPLDENIIHALAGGIFAWSRRKIDASTFSG